MIRKQNKKLFILIAAGAPGALPTLFFKNDFLLTYLARLDIASADIFACLSLNPLIVFLFTIPSAYPIFPICHLAFFIVVFLFIIRDLIPFPVISSVGILSGTNQLLSEPFTTLYPAGTESFIMIRTCKMFAENTNEKDINCRG